jgi:hypothetical protein
VLVLFSAALGACADPGAAIDPSTPEVGGTGSLRILLHDRAADEVDEVWIEFSAVLAHNDLDGWIVVSDDTQAVDLLSLTDGVVAEMAWAAVPTGPYSQVRFHLAAAWVVVNGETLPLDVPSGLESGVKLIESFEVVECSDTTFTLDWDVGAHLIHSPGSGYKLRPTLNVDSLATQPGEWQVWHADSDGDEYGDPDVSTEDCLQPPGYVQDDTDCDDGDQDIHPGADEIWYDGIDQDCDGESDYDGDGDGEDHWDYGGDDCWDEDAGTNPLATESCDGHDNDCDGSVDEGDVCPSVYWPPPRARHALDTNPGGHLVAPLLAPGFVLDDGSELTIEMWVKTTIDGCWEDLFWAGNVAFQEYGVRTCSSDGRTIWHVESQEASGGAWETTITGSDTFSGQWQFLAVQLAADGTMSLWLDGTEQATLPGYNGLIDPPDSIWIATGAGETNREKNGLYGFVRVSSVARYSSTFVGIPGELRTDEHTIAAWAMDQPSGATVEDLSGYGQDGTMVGAPTWVPTSY